MSAKHFLASKAFEGLKFKHYINNGIMCHQYGYCPQQAVHVPLCSIPTALLCSSQKHLITWIKMFYYYCH